MRTSPRTFHATWATAAVLGLGWAGHLAGADWSAWANRQELAVPAAGLIRVSLPAETLGAAQAGLEDLRLLDPAGNEVPYAILRPRPRSPAVQPAKSFGVKLTAQATVMTVEHGLGQPIEAVLLESPAGSFVKAVQVEGSADQKTWEMLSTHQPIFRQGGTAQLEIPVPAGLWPFLRLTVNDQRSAPIALSGASVRSAAGEAPTEAVLTLLGERVENPGQTRLAVSLGAANLDLASLHFDTTEPLFTRRVTVLVRQVSENAVREQAVAEGVIYRVAVDGQVAATRLAVEVDRQVRAREVVVLIRNDDSPPLAISEVRAQRRPVQIVFHARQAGQFGVLTGHPRAAAPRYDLGALGTDWRAVALAPVPLPPPGRNPAFRPPEVLPEIREEGAAIDVAEWRYRKPIRLEAAGAVQVELDAEVMAHAQPGWADLRLVRGGKQVAYILEHTSISRALRPEVTPASDPKKPRETRWKLKLPLARLPVDRLQAESPTPLFRREVRLYELARDERGERYERALGQAAWVQTPGRKERQFSLALSSRPTTDTLYLATDNGDNPAIELAQFQLHHPATRLLFKSSGTSPLALYYGNPEAAAAAYDLSLVAPQLMSADKAPATLGAEETLKKNRWGEAGQAGKGGVIFWGVLSLVVAALLIIITRLLPHRPKA